MFCAASPVVARWLRAILPRQAVTDAQCRSPRHLFGSGLRRVVGAVLFGHPHLHQRIWWAIFFDRPRGRLRAEWTLKQVIRHPFWVQWWHDGDSYRKQPPPGEASGQNWHYFTLHRRIQLDPPPADTTLVPPQSRYLEVASRWAEYRGPDRQDPLTVMHRTLAELYGTVCALCGLRYAQVAAGAGSDRVRTRDLAALKCPSTSCA